MKVLINIVQEQNRDMKSKQTGAVVQQHFCMKNTETHLFAKKKLWNLIYFVAHMLMFPS